MNALVVAGGTDPGRIRPANEDAYWIGETVFAVADGMGGHLAGEVASATALQPVRELDGQVFPDAPAAVEALRSALEHANEQVVAKATADPSYRGMGTTLTTVLAEGRRLHVAHVGDSRAYLLRGGELTQITQDHTLVQHLIDEGQITREEAAYHPQRSIITRAIGVSTDVNVDVLTMERRPEDQVLLCSDGLSGVVADDDIAAVLMAGQDAETTVQALVDLANRNGGPDNITCVLLRSVAGRPNAAGTNGHHVEAAPGAERRIVVRASDAASEDHWAQRLGHLGASPQDDRGRFEEAPRTGRARWQRVGAVVAAVALLAVLVIGGGRWLLSRSYYVGLEDGRVAIFQGVPASLGPVEFSWEFEETTLTADELPEFMVSAFAEGRTAADLGDARRIVANARASAEERAAAASDAPAPPPPTEATP